MYVYRKFSNISQFTRSKRRDGCGFVIHTMREIITHCMRIFHSGTLKISKKYFEKYFINLLLQNHAIHQQQSSCSRKSERI